VVGRYALWNEIGSGGMATVVLGRQLGSAGFSRVVAIKRLHPGHAKDPDFVEMFLDEARLAARVRHPNVVGTLDVVHDEGELFLVMEYVAGESVGTLIRRARKRGAVVPVPIAASIASGALHGLHAAHQATAEDGTHLGIVHRDVSPQNILVGTDGVARVLDFGIAKANVRLAQTREGHAKGKLQYMSPEQISGERVTPAADVYAMGIVLWELCAGRRAFEVDSEVALLAAVAQARVPQLLTAAPWVPPALAAVVHRAVSEDPRKRYPSARDMAAAIEGAVTLATPLVVSEWVNDMAAETLRWRAAIVRRIENSASPGSTDAAILLENARASIPRTPSKPISIPPMGDISTRIDVVSEVGKHTATHIHTHTITNARIERVRKRAWGAWVGGAVAMASLAGGSLWFYERQTERAHPAKTAARISAAMVVVPVTPESQQVATAEPTASADAPIASASADAAPTTSEPQAVQPIPKLGPGRLDELPRPQVMSQLPVAVSACDPPTYIDASGISRVKRECLGKAH